MDVPFYIYAVYVTRARSQRQESKTDKKSYSEIIINKRIKNNLNYKKLIEIERQNKQQLDALAISIRIDHM